MSPQEIQENQTNEIEEHDITEIIGRIEMLEKTCIKIGEAVEAINESFDALCAKLAGE